MWIVVLDNFVVPPGPAPPRLRGCTGVRAAERRTGGRSLAERPRVRRRTVPARARSRISTKIYVSAALWRVRLGVRRTALSEPHGLLGRLAGRGGTFGRLNHTSRVNRRAWTEASTAPSSCAV